MASAPPNGRGCFEESSVGRYKILSWKILAARPWTILARDNVARLSSTASCDTVSFNGTRTTRRGTIEGWGDILGTAPLPPSVVIVSWSPVDKARPIIFTFLSRQLGPFCSFSMPRLRARFILSFLPHPECPCPRNRGKIYRAGGIVGR